MPFTVITIICALYFDIISSVVADDYSVIIIGAGASGVAAAAKLLENNQTDILILEAESRIGGRIHSVYFGEAYVELGAEWCQGKTNNTVYELASPLVPLKREERLPRIVYSGGEVDEEFQSDLNIIQFECLVAKNIENANLTTRDFNMVEYENRIKEAFGNDSEKLKIGLLSKRLFELEILGWNSAFYLDNVTSKSGFVYSENDTDYSWQGYGYKTILDILIHKYPDEAKALPFYSKLRLNEEAVKIRWKENDGVVVQTKNGASYKGKRVIFTPSLNVLKERHREIFEPELPAFKQEAMNSLGMDAALSLFAYFTKKWWPDPGDYLGYTFMWDEQSLNEIKDTNYSWTLSVKDVYPLDRNPKVLSVWVPGPDVPKIELLSDEELSHGLYFVLTKFLGNKFNVTYPNKVLKSDWYNNPHFRGAHSYETPRSYLKSPSPQVLLARPLSNQLNEEVLFFAGEATHQLYYSTVQGAIDTGFEVANKIIELTTNN